MASTFLKTMQLAKLALALDALRRLTSSDRDNLLLSTQSTEYQVRYGGVSTFELHDEYEELIVRGSKKRVLQALPPPEHIEFMQLGIGGYMLNVSMPGHEELGVPDDVNLGALRLPANVARHPRAESVRPIPPSVWSTDPPPTGLRTSSSRLNNVVTLERPPVPREAVYIVDDVLNGYIHGVYDPQTLRHVMQHDGRSPLTRRQITAIRRVPSNIARMIANN